MKALFSLLAISISSFAFAGGMGTSGNNEILFLFGGLSFVLLSFYFVPKIIQAIRAKLSH